MRTQQFYFPFYELGFVFIHHHHHNRVMKFRARSSYHIWFTFNGGKKRFVIIVPLHYLLLLLLLKCLRSHHLYYYYYLFPSSTITTFTINKISVRYNITSHTSHHNLSHHVTLLFCSVSFR